MKQENLDKIHCFWAKSLGGPKQKVENPQSGIYTRKEPTDYTSQHNERKVDIFLKEDAEIISCDEKYLSEVRKLEGNLSGLDMSESSLEEAGLQIDEILGPAFLSFTDSESFQPEERSSCRKLNESDEEKLEELKSNSDEEEIENSISDYEVSDNLFGKFEDGELVAVSGYEIWDNEIAFLVVFVSENYRGKGFGKEIVSEAVEHSLKNNLIPFYRTLEEWSSSVDLAKNLGFEKYATTYLIELKEK